LWPADRKLAMSRSMVLDETPNSNARVAVDICDDVSDSRDSNRAWRPDITLLF